MYSENNDDFGMYYAYLKKETNDFGSAHVSLKIANDALFLIIKVEEPISLPDLQGLLLNLQNNICNRLRIDIVRETEVMLYIGDMHSIVSLEKENDELKIVSITPFTSK